MALSKYEVVTLFWSSTSWNNIDKIKKEVESMLEEFWWKVLYRDDIGYLEESIISWNPYYYSLFTELEWVTIKDLKRKLSIIEGVDRVKIFKMKDNQKFLKFKEIEKELKDIDFSDISKNGIFHEIESK